MTDYNRYYITETGNLMVEVFKTNVKEADQANLLLDQIHKTFRDYRANFDLQDCDKILRVKSGTGHVYAHFIINLLNHFGFHAEILADEVNVCTR